LEEATKSLIAAHLEKAAKKLDVAQRLFDSGDYDDAISRAYYASFHACQALLLTEGHKAESHKGALTLFSLLFVKTGKLKKELGKGLSNLKDDRESSDYEVFSYQDRDTAQQALEEAQAFLKEARHYLAAQKILP
jgi:uncharacterized protein (UPF0332 family)